MRTRYSPRAIDDLIAIADYLTEQNPTAARAVESKIRSTVDFLAEFSAGGRLLDQRKQVRVMPIARYPYLVFYTVKADEVIILHVRHGARAPVDLNDL